MTKPKLTTRALINEFLTAWSGYFYEEARSEALDAIVVNPKFDDAVIATEALGHRFGLSIEDTLEEFYLAFAEEFPRLPLEGLYLLTHAHSELGKRLQAALKTSDEARMSGSSKQQQEVKAVRAQLDRNGAIALINDLLEIALEDGIASAV